MAINSFATQPPKKNKRFNKHLGKKAIFFTSVALLMIAAIILGFTIYETFSLREQSSLESVRIRSMNYFTEDIERDMHRSLYIASFRALLGASQYVTDNGLFLDDYSNQLEELVLYGTINGSYTNMTEDSYFFEWVDRVKSVGAEIGTTVEFNDTNISVFQSNPWSVTLQLDTLLSVEDSSRQVIWRRQKRINTTISILEFEDPLYTVYSSKRLINTVRQSPYTDFTTGTDDTNLTLHMENSYYIQSDSGPSFLQRLEGDVTASSEGTGIESLIDVGQLTFVGLDTNSSIVDYIYWGNIPHTSFFINGTSFKLDNSSNHLQIYEVEHLLNGT